MFTAQFLTLIAALITVIIAITLAASRSDWKARALDAERRLLLNDIEIAALKGDKDRLRNSARFWKDLADDSLTRSEAAARQLAHVVVAANTTPAPTSPTDNETSVA